MRGTRARNRRHRQGVRVGVFGLLGSGSIGNDGSLEVVLDYLRRSHPEATIDAMCMGAAEVEARYGIKATPLYFATRFADSSRWMSAPFRMLGKFADVYRTAVWVRRHDAVIVPGMGVLEASLPLRFWQTPYAIFLLCLSGKVFGTKVALVSVGASEVTQRVMRCLLNTAARMSFYVSYRDQMSLSTMEQRGVDTTRHHVYPDLVFKFPLPSNIPIEERTVGVGIMAYFGGSADGYRAQELHDRYVATMRLFLLWLVDNGYRIRLITGDTQVDNELILGLREGLYRDRPHLDQSLVVVAPISSMSELMYELSRVESVVAARFHNVLCALMLGKPTISVGYSAKHRALMEDVGMMAFCHPPDTPDIHKLVDQFRSLNEGAARDLARVAVESNVTKAYLLDEQFDLLSSILFEHDDALLPV
jgi:polysaccharide pyruvyl transferase WcaK-like protein